MKIRFNFNKSDAIKIAAYIMVLPVVLFCSLTVLPYIKPLIEQAAVYSASLSFTPEKPLVIPDEYSFIDDSFEENYTNIVDEPTIEYDDTLVETSSQPESTESEPESQTQTDKPKNAGIIERKTYVAGDTSVYINLKEGYIKNCTTLPAQKILDGVKANPKIKIQKSSKPQVLIMHTHATESYQATELDYFNKTDATRTTDNTKNVTRVGDEIEKQLKAAGIGVIHDRTLHDYPSYNGAYERSAVTVKRILKENPTIKVVLDVHRDAIQPNADTMIAPITTIEGKKCAQVMIISGCDDGKMNMPKYMENLKFSAALQRQMEKDYKSLARPILFDYRKYNQNLTTGSILLEMGGHANTLDEAIYCGELVGKSLVKVLLALK